jgi:ligand-binding sensor domain-containing protein
MLLDRDERSVWVGFDGDMFNDSACIVHFDGYTVKKRFNKTDGLTANRITAIARDSSENIWFASDNEVAVLRDTKLTTYFKDSDGGKFGACKALFVDRSGSVWSYFDNGIAQFDGSSWKLFDSVAVSPDLPYAMSSQAHIIQDKSGTVWFGTEGSGLLAYKDNKWYQFTTCDGLPANTIHGCVLDNKDNLWVLTEHGIAMRKFDENAHNNIRRNFINRENKRFVKQCGNRFYISSKDKPETIRYTLFDFRGRVVHKQIIHRRNSFVIPENKFCFGSGIRILSILTEDINGKQNKYFLKLSSWYL